MLACARLTRANACSDSDSDEDKKPMSFSSAALMVAEGGQVLLVVVVVACCFCGTCVCVCVWLLTEAGWPWQQQKSLVAKLEEALEEEEEDTGPVGPTFFPSDAK